MEGVMARVLGQVDGNANGSDGFTAKMKSSMGGGRNGVLVAILFEDARAISKRIANGSLKTGDNGL